MPVAIIIISVLAVLAVIIAINNKNIGITEYDVRSSKINSPLVILHISDFHNCKFGRDQHRLLDKVRSKGPDIIVITGDFIDSRNTRVSVSSELADAISGYAPVYYVNGNHESRVPESYEVLKKHMLRSGITVLENSCCEITVKGNMITVFGISDPDFRYGEPVRNVISEELDGLDTDRSGYRILLSHRPETSDIYSRYGYDMVLCGHAHGGQIRIPFIGGVFSPGQGFFPKYSEGISDHGGMKMIVSRGLGNTSHLVRINNNPELVCIHLLPEDAANS